MELFTPAACWPEDEHFLVADAARRFFADRLVPNIGRYRKQGYVDRDFWLEAGRAGLMSGAVPEAYGGTDGGLGFDSVVLYELARVGDTSWGYGIQSIVIHYVLNYGSDDQKSYWLPRLLSGEVIGALAMSEPGTGSDLQAIRTTATMDGNLYRISGSKMFITNGWSADLVVLAVKTDPKRGAQGLSLILVDTRDAEGFRRGRRLEKLGLHGNDTAELFFDEVKVPLTNLLGEEEGQGFYQLMRQLPWERLVIAITALGAMDCALKETVEYVKSRKAFGRRIMDFQNTRFKLAEVKTKTELLRSFVNDCIAELERGELSAEKASMAKYWGTETQNWIMDECLQLHGGYGYMMEFPIAWLYADARVQKIYGGTNEIMKELIARSIDS
ncbi:MAG: acyl-CoA dehydrogenase family protein [Rhodobacteraceae bacterium]|nr:acyl-CoA dehydrogenase family protein [Paracoccaceae bacterium]